MKATSKAIRELLERKGVVPTGDSETDIKEAKKYLPKPYKRIKS